MWYRESLLEKIEISGYIHLKKVYQIKFYLNYQLFHIDQAVTTMKQVVWDNDNENNDFWWI